jgi:activator of HSP90 ATPase
MESFHVSEVFHAKPQTVYYAFLDSEMHTKMTGSPADITAKVKGRFDAWEGYITGTITELMPYRKIVQKWRTKDFPEDSPDSVLEILLEGVKEGTRLTLKHTKIPDGQGEGYKKGWVDHYFTPMKKYFKG